MKFARVLRTGAMALCTIGGAQGHSSNRTTWGDHHQQRHEKELTYIPGKAVVKENGLLLSQGLASRLIAVSGERVKLHEGGRSDDTFHELPDGAAVFVDPKGTNYKYVSNSEKNNGNGGVGSLTFDKNGNVIGYERLLRGTTMNCGGGKTYWNTWLSCEEYDDGHIWEVNPWSSKKQARRTVLGRGYAAHYESAAYDHRRDKAPTFYATVDRPNGPLLRYSPPQSVIETARNTNDYSELLHTEPDANERDEAYQYLVLNPDDETFSWTSRVGRAEDSAERHYRNCEGLDIRNGMLYMTCKDKKQLYILNLDAQTYTVSSTRSGAFDGQPDQVARLLQHDKGLLYFCEDAGALTGVHGRDTNGKYFTILQGQRGSNDGETSGLAFSPGNKFMYVSFQKEGKIFEIRRRDGEPFHGQRLDIKYHGDKDNDDPF